jgi:DNA-binding response OmpR family regulator
MATTILIVANEKATTSSLSASFNKKEFAVLTAHSGRQALAQAKARLPDAIIVDSTSPRINSKRLCRALRAETYAILVLLVSNLSKSESLNGVNLVLPKSTSPKKLTQRVRSALEDKPPREMRIGNLTLDVEKRRVARGNKIQKLTPKEFELLKLFMDRPGQVISRKILMKEIWNTEYLGDTRTLDVHIRWLREKIEDQPSKPHTLVTMRGQGYCLSIDEE